MTHHVSIALPDGRTAVADYREPIVRIMRRVNSALMDRRPGDPADLWAIKLWLDANQEMSGRCAWHLKPDGPPCGHEGEGEMDMVKEIHILGIDPGGTTGWALLTVPVLSIFGDEDPQILEWDYGELDGPEPEQATEIARLAREIQSLDYKTGPAIISEAWTVDPRFKSRDPVAFSPIRINAMLSILQYQGRLADATLTFQSRELAGQAYTDDRLKALGFWVEGSTHIRSAIRHALTGLRRAAENIEFAARLWPYPAKHPAG